MCDIIFLIVGIIILIKGRFSVTKTKEIRRPGSIFVGLLFIAPFPLSFLVGAILAANAIAGGQDPGAVAEDTKTLRVVGAIIVLCCVIAGLVLAFVLAKPKSDPLPRKRPARDYDDYEDSPRRRRSAEDDEEDRPRRRKRADEAAEDEEDDRPSRRKRDDDDDRPRRRPRDDFDDRAR